MLVLNILILASDCVIYVLEYFPSAPFIILNHAACMTYFLLQLWFCCDWLRYVLLRLRPRYRRSGLEKALFLLPAFANGLLVVSSPITGWIYSVSAANVYHRGPFIWVPFTVAIIYWIWSSAVILREKHHPSKSREPGEYWTLLLFPLPILAGNVVQLLYYGLSIVWVCSVISMLAMFMDMQNQQLIRDPLTGLYNRRQADAQLAWEISHLRNNDDLLFVAIFDVDDFKRINDIHGHLSGDRALTAAAGALKENCRKSDQAARFGGDEFLLSGHVESAEQADEIMRRIESSMVLVREKEGLPYDLSFSSGYALLRPEDETTADLALDEADRRMYAVKREKKLAR